MACLFESWEKLNADPLRESILPRIGFVYAMLYAFVLGMFVMAIVVEVTPHRRDFGFFALGAFCLVQLLRLGRLNWVRLSEDDSNQR